MYKGGSTKPFPDLCLLVFFFKFQIIPVEKFSLGRWGNRCSIGLSDVVIVSVPYCKFGCYSPLDLELDFGSDCTTS